MTAALKTVDAHRVAADLFGFERMAHGSAFVDHLDPGRLQHPHICFRAAAGGLDDLDAALDDGADIFGIGRRRKSRQESEIHTERLVRHLVAAGDFLCEQFRRLLRETGDDAQSAGVGDRRREFGKSDVVHAALDDRMLDAEHFGDGCLHMSLPALTGRATFVGMLTISRQSGGFQAQMSMLSTTFDRADYKMSILTSTALSDRVCTEYE